MLEMPAPHTPGDAGFFFKLQYCAVTRLLRAAQILRSLAIYKDEKIAGRFHRGIHLLRGISATAVHPSNATMVLQPDTAVRRQL